LVPLAILLLKLCDFKLTHW